jgi:hypothetical protein
MVGNKALINSFGFFKGQRFYLGTNQYLYRGDSDDGLYYYNNGNRYKVSLTSSSVTEASNVQYTS